MTHCEVVNATVDLSSDVPTLLSTKNEPSASCHDAENILFLPYIYGKKYAGKRGGNSKRGHDDTHLGTYE